uniref:Uncharacterized protein n=1 Tax=viral metagenome TaxID=1070528 RepID=A0A6C0JIE3_9ZZZZ
MPQLHMLYLKKGQRLQYSHPPYGKTLYGTVLSIHKSHFVFKFDNIAQSRQYVSLDCFSEINNN